MTCSENMRWNDVVQTVVFACKPFILGELSCALLMYNASDSEVHCYVG